MGTPPKNKAMEDFFANMPNPDAMFQSWWPFILAGTCGTIYGFRQWIRGPRCVGGTKLANKTVIVTGASGSIGQEIAMELAKRDAKVILAGRDEVAGRQMAESIRKQTENMDVYFLRLDLGSFSSIREFVEKFKKKEKNLHILINNAGVMLCPKEKTEDGFELQFQVNYLGHFLLTELLLDRLKESAPSRIINTTASAYALGNIDFEDIGFDRKEYVAGDAFAQSKLAVVLHTFQLANRLKDTGVTCNVVNPGICNTNIYRHLPLKSSTFIRYSFSPFMWLLMKYPEDGAQIAIYCATAAEQAEVSGKFLKECKVEEIQGVCQDQMLQEQLYFASLKWTKLEQGDGDKAVDQGEKEGTEPGEVATDVANSSQASKHMMETHSKMDRVYLYD